MEVFVESFRSRSSVPLESISAFSVLLAFLRPASLSFTDKTVQAPPIKLCGHVYANPPGVFYFYSYIPVVFLAGEKVLQVLLRIFEVLTRDTHAPILVPTIHSYYRGGLTVSYKRNLMTFFRPAVLAAMCFSVPIVFGRLWPSCYFVLCGVGCVQAINMLLGVINWFCPLRNNPEWRLFLEVLSVFVTEHGLEDPGLENKNWNSVETGTPATNGIGEDIRSKSQGALFDAGDGKYLYVSNTSDIGFKGSLSNLLSFAEIETAVKVDKEINFRLVPLRVPYALLWYGIHGMIFEMGGFVGAEEIDKCVVWLLLVSAITELIIWAFPGPAVVVKAVRQHEN